MAEEGSTRKLICTGVFLINVVLCQTIRFGEVSNTLHFPIDRSEEFLTRNSMHITVDKQKLYNAKDDVDEILSRYVRDTSSANGRSTHAHPTNISTVAHLNTSFSQLYVHWAGSDSDVIIALSKDIETQDTQAGSQLYISKDYGKTFHEVRDALMINDTTPAIIDSFYDSKAVNTHFVFSDKVHRCMFTTRNFGETFHKFCDLPFEAKSYILHPTDVNIILAYNSTHLYSTIDFGFTWSLLHWNVKSFFWGVLPYDSNPVTLYVEETRGPSSSNVHRSNNLVVKKILDSNRIWQHRVVIDNVEDFEVKGPYLYATKRVNLFGSRHDTLQLWVSYERKEFSNAVFPSLRRRLDYYVADASEGQVMVCVSDSNNLANLYISEVEGVDFTLSLERVVYYYPRGSNDDSWMRSQTSVYADVYKVDGMRGIYIASQLNSNLTEQISLITYDKGGEWERITAPLYDRYGKPTNCSQWERCSLHLNLSSSSSESVPILSTKSAPGIVIASGVIGKNMKGVPDVYLSSNAGYSWHQILAGIYMYTIGDHGGIIVALQRFTVTNEIFYSTNEGETWQTIKFLDGDNKIKIYGLMTEPGETTTIFSIFGSHLDHHSWLLVQLDLKSVFRNITCKKEDYKMWSMPDTNPDHGCLLGKKILYERRVSHALCYNGKHYVREQIHQNCSCRRDDYECDIGFKTNSLVCVPDPEQNGFNIHQIPFNCTEGSFYPYTRGYRKVSGDSCKGGEEHRYDPFLYSCPIQNRNEFLLYTTRDQIGRVNLDNNRNEILINSGLQDVTAVEFDYVNDCVFWADIAVDKIKKLCFGATESRSVVDIITTKLQTVEGLAYDWTAKTIYWVDSEAKTIEVAKADGNYRHILINETHLDRPRSIALHPRHGLMFWTDWSVRNPRVCQAWMDGNVSSIRTIVSGRSNLQWPNGITIDIQMEKIYWTDAGKHTIMSANFDGTNQLVIVRGQFNLPHPYGVGIYKDNIYWTDWGKEGVLMADKTSGMSQVVILGNLTGIADMKVISHTAQQVTGACTISNSRCSQLCLPRPNPVNEGQINRTCKCGDEFVTSITPGTSDEDCGCGEGEQIVNGTCDKSGNSSCSAERYMCNNGQCIPSTWKCDHDDDCSDGSDEMNCAYRTCDENQVNCASGRCIPRTWQCDFDNDCGDNSDEKNCEYRSCDANEFTCDNKICISKTWTCDFENDCHDGSDERGCNMTAICHSWEFNCSSGECIGQNRQCDGVKDCSDGSDEENCEAFTCSMWRHKCRTGNQCIFSTWQCDGEKDCVDGSDEDNCTISCFLWQFTCGSGECISEYQVCDNISHCNDSSDEANCANRTSTTPVLPTATCSTNQFTCSNGECINDRLRCNGNDDCTDHSDELGCPTEHVQCLDNQFHCNETSDSDTEARHCIWDSWVCDGQDDCSHGEDEINCPDKPKWCDEKSFSCRYSYGCISSSMVCDGTQQCADGTDEHGCLHVTKPPPTQGCDPTQYYTCNDLCVEWPKTCDGTRECIDGSDEQFPRCTNHSVRVYGIRVTNVTSSSVSVHWSSPNVTGAHYIFSIRKKSGNDKKPWRNETVRNTYHVETFLEAETTYLATVYIVNQDGIVNSAAPPITIVTREAVPSKPTKYRCYLMSEDEKAEIKVTWAPPVHHNGHIALYGIYFKDLKTGITDSKTIRPFSSRLQASLVNELTPEHRYSIWVTAINQAGEGQGTTPINITFTNKIAGSDLKADSVKVKTSEDAIVLSWSKVKAAVNYTVFYYFSSDDQSGELKKLITKNNQVTINNICSGELYNIELQVNTKYGPSSLVTKSIIAPGKSFGHPTINYVKKTGKTQVDIDFNPPQGKDKDKLNYIIYYKEQTEMDTATNIKGYKKINTPLKHKSIHGLKACEKYYFKVGVAHQCLLSLPVSVITEEDVEAEPKRLSYVFIHHDSIKLSWHSPCSYDLVKLDYIIEKKEDKKPRQAHPLGKPTKEDEVYTVINNLVRGVNYTFRVKTHVQNSRFSEPLIVTIPPYAPVEDLIVEYVKDQTFRISWRMSSEDHPSNKFFKEYNLDITRDADTKYSLSKKTTESQLEVKLTPGFVYRFTVKYQTQNGVYSQEAKVELPYFDKSADKSVPSSSVLISKTNLVAIVVPISLIILILATVLVVMAVRHRRLQRSFTAFTNSHYDTRSGVTIFANEELGDDDTPLIQGFSDDEPLVLA